MKPYLLLLSFLFSFTISKSQNYFQDSRWKSPYGKVNKVIIDSASNRVYVGGDFEYVGAPQQHLFLYDAINNARLKNIDQPNSAVSSSISDENGGFYIGGLFNKVAGENRGRIAHINKEGKLLPDLAGLTISGNVTSMKKDGDRLYLGGSFLSAGKVSEFNFGAAILNSSGEIENDNFPEVFGEVKCSYMDEKGGIYIGGSFTRVGDSIRTNLAHIDSNGIVTSWNPLIDKPVFAITGKGDTIFIGGNFDEVNTHLRNKLAALHAVNGSLFSWNPSLNGRVYSFCKKGNSLYVGGSFSAVGDSTRQSFVEFLISTGDFTPFNLNIFPSGTQEIHCMKMQGHTLYLGGNFSNILGQNRRKLAAVNTTNQSLLNWNPDVANHTFVYDMEVIDSTVYVSGNFHYVGGLIRENLAAIHASSGAVLPFNPNFSTSTKVLDVFVKGNTVYAVGRFSEIAGVKRDNIAAFNKVSGALQTWNPATSTSYNDISHLINFKNNFLVFGKGNLFGGKRTNGLAVVDLMGDSLLSLASPEIGGSINQIETLGDTLIVCGNFNTVGNNNRNNIALLNKNTGALLPFNPDVNRNIRSISLDDKTLYITGDFSTIGGVSREKLAAIDLVSGQLLPFNANITGGNSSFLVKSLGDTLFVSGGYWSIGGQTFNSNLIALNKLSGNAYTWNPKVNGTCLAIDEYAGHLYTGGYFKEIDSEDQYYMGKIDKDSALLKPFFHANSFVHTISSSENGIILYGGSFKSAGGKIRKSLATYELNTGALTDLAIDIDHYLNDMELVDSNLIVAGYIFKISGQGARNISAINLNTGLKNTTLIGNIITVGGYPRDIELDGHTLYFSGDFRSVNNQTRVGIAAYDLNTQSLLPWYPDPSNNKEVYSIELDNDSIYIGGNFSTINGQSRYGVAKISKDSAALSPWFPGARNNRNANDIHAANGKVFIGGSFTGFANGAENYMVAVDDATGTVDPNYSYQPNGTINFITSEDSLLYLGGNYSYLASTSVKNKAIINLNTGLIAERNNGSSRFLDFYEVQSGEVHTMEKNHDLLFVGTAEGLEVYNRDTLGFCVNEIVNNVSECGSFTWNVNNVTYTKGGSYTILKSTANACDTLFILNLAIDSVSTLTNNTNNSITASETNANYQWLDCNNGYAPISNAVSQQFFPSTNGVYAVELNRQNCRDTSACVAMLSVSVQKSSLTDQFVFYPNPVSESITFETSFSIDKIEIFNPQKKVSNIAQLRDKSIKVDFLTPGIYYLRVTLKDGQQIVRKFIKQ